MVESSKTRESARRHNLSSSYNANMEFQSSMSRLDNQHITKFYFSFFYKSLPPSIEYDFPSIQTEVINNLALPRINHIFPP